MTRTLIICEVGVNHNGDIELAKQMVKAAAIAGADLVKFQTFRAKDLAVFTAPKAGYQFETTDSEESQYEMLSRLELCDEDHFQLVKTCRENEVGFLSTGFDLKSVDFLNSLGAQTFKIPSGDITNLPYLRHVGKLNKSVILSTGMANLGEIEAAVGALVASGTAKNKITVLHCNTQYPTPMEDVNLSAMKNIGHALGVKVGYSDHTAGIEVPIAAVALGAEVIEKHMTLDRSMSGPDHRASIEPDEFKRMANSIRNIEKALGDGVKKPTKSELQNRDISRKSLVASKQIVAGRLFTEENITAKRPGSGISPMRWDDLIGKRANKNYETDDQIES